MRVFLPHEFSNTMITDRSLIFASITRQRPTAVMEQVLRLTLSQPTFLTSGLVLMKRITRPPKPSTEFDVAVVY